ncbi:MAG TPA: hypothetical protein VGM23_13465 [Armatimonadota bacterium]|jgi:hypothetical protein
MARKQSQFIMMLLIISGVGLLVLAAGIFLLNTQYQQKKTLEAQNDALVATCETYEANTAKANMENLRDKKAGLDKQLASLDHNLVTYQYIPTFLGDIQKATEMTNNHLVSIQPGEVKPLANSNLFTPTASATTSTAAAKTEVVGQNPAPTTTVSADVASKYQTQQIVMEVQGTYSSTMQLLDLLRRFPKLVYLRSVNLNPTGGDAVSLHLETYAIIIPDQYKAPGEKKMVLMQGGGVQQ